MAGIMFADTGELPGPWQTLGQNLSQTWPAKLAASAWDAAKLPGDVYQGKVDPLSTQGVERATDLAGMVMGGTFAGAPAGAVGAGPVRRRAVADALPMDEASRLGRAQEQGYTIDAYKGAYPYSDGPEWHGFKRVEKPYVDLTEFQTPGRPYSGFFSNEPAVADRFAQVHGGSTFPVKLKMDNPVVIDGKGKPAAAWQFESIAREHGMLDEFNTYQKAWEKPGHDGVVVRNTADEGDVFIPRQSNQVRSKWAAFDPANKDSGHLLGSLLGISSLPAAGFMFGNSSK